MQFQAYITYPLVFSQALACVQNGWLHDPRAIRQISCKCIHTARWVVGLITNSIIFCKLFAINDVMIVTLFDYILPTQSAFL